MKHHITKLATRLSTGTCAVLALLVHLGTPANAAVVLGGEDGWEVSYGGFVNLFYTQSDFQYTDGRTEDSAHLNEGLLPGFHTMTVKTPEVNGLKGTSQITFAVDSSSEKGSRLNKSGLFGTGSNIDMREVFFNVEGDFGTISVGRTLSLFMRQDILKDYTLFGVGALAGPDGGGTALGRIGFGYVYPDFRTRFVYQTPEVNGFQLSVGIFDPQEPLGGTGFTAETDTPQFQAEATYKSDFEGGSFSIWGSVLWQEQEITSSPGTAADPGEVSVGPAPSLAVTGVRPTAAAVPGATGDIESVGVNIGAEINAGGFNVSGHYYTGEALGTLFFNAGGGNGFGCDTTSCQEADNDGYYIQTGYKFNGTTLLGVTYGKSEQDADAINPEVENRLWTVGVYHDVNSWLKVIAEYSNYESTQLGIADADTFSIGGFLLW